MPMIRSLVEPGTPIDRIATFMLVNLMWFMFAVFILPLPAATAGLFAVLVPWVRGKDTELFSTFFGGMWRHWRKSTVIGLLDVALFGLIAINFSILNEMGDSIFSWMIRGLNLFVVFAVLITNIYIWPLLVLFDLPLKRLLNVSLRMAFGHLFWSLLVLLVLIVVLGIMLSIPVFVGLFSAFSSLALITNYGAWRIIKRYATAEDLADLR